MFWTCFGGPTASRSSLTEQRSYAVVPKLWISGEWKRRLRQIHGKHTYQAVRMPKNPDDAFGLCDCLVLFLNNTWHYGKWVLLLVVLLIWKVLPLGFHPAKEQCQTQQTRSHAAFKEFKLWPPRFGSFVSWVFHMDAGQYKPTNHSVFCAGECPQIGSALRPGAICGSAASSQRKCRREGGGPELTGARLWREMPWNGNQEHPSVSYRTPQWKFLGQLFEHSRFAQYQRNH